MFYYAVGLGRDSVAIVGVHGAILTTLHMRFTQDNWCKDNS
jgi:hypothetical protein